MEVRYRQFMNDQPKGKDVSIWIDTTPQTNFPSLNGDIETDVAVVGGGIVGITCAYLLSKHGLRVVLLEKNKLIGKTTGNTTAKVTSLHSLIYAGLVKGYGEDFARLYGQANQSGVEIVGQIAAENNIDCDLISGSTFTFAATEDARKRVEDEYSVVKKLGFPARFAEKISLPVPSFGAVEFTHQSQFHPRKYLLGLVNKLTERSVLIFENTEALEVQDKAVVTKNGKIKAQYIVAASHIPFFNKEEFKTKMTRSRDYVIAMRVKGEKPKGMFINAGATYHSIRTQPYEGDELVIVDGEWHKVDDQEILDPQHYLNLQKWAREYFDVEEFEYFWSTYDWSTGDRIPFAGHFKDNLYYATGFSGWGMANGTATAVLITDLIRGKENPWVDLYNPKRMEG